jgi:hypothetical protein
MSQNVEVYKSAPLPLNSSNKIRLLKINFTLADTSTISCTLKEFPLEEAPSYIAVSYVWGTDTPKHRIRLQRQPFEVRKNLWDFLRQKSLEGSSAQFYWIDAICIDQSNVVERSHQVRLMGQIYSKADTVLAWLGTGAPKLQCAFGFLQKLRGSMYNHPSEPDLWQKPSQRYLKGIHSLRRLNYWKRAWVIQECVLATRLEFQYEDVRVCSTALEMVDRVIHSYAWQQHPQSTSRSGAWVDHTQWLASPVYDLLTARQSWHDCSRRTFVKPWTFPPTKKPMLECSDSRDRIYSQLALMHADAKIDPDYSKSCADLFVEIVQNYVALDWIYAEQTLGWLQTLLVPSDGADDNSRQMYFRYTAALVTQVRKKRGTNTENLKDPEVIAAWLENNPSSIDEEELPSFSTKRRR